MKEYDYKYWFEKLEYYDEHHDEIVTSWKKLIDSNADGTITNSLNQYKFGDISYSSVICPTYSTDKLTMINHNTNLKVEINKGIHVIFEQHIDDLQITAQLGLGYYRQFVYFMKDFDGDLKLHNPYGPASACFMRDDKQEIEYWIDGLHITDWLEQKGYTLPLSDKQQYEFELKYS